MTHWIYALMVWLAPSAPWSSTYWATASAIDRVAHDSPLYETDDGIERTAAELVAVAYFESRFDPEAVFTDRGGDSLGLEQINTSNLARLGLTRAEALEPEANLRAAVRLMRASHRTCRGHPREELLGHYASGGPTCTVAAGLVASRHRMRLAEAILRERPVYWVEATR